MNYIDVILCIPLLWGIYKGISKGLVVEVASVLALVLGIWGGIRFSDYVAGALTEAFDIQTDYLPVVAFALVFIGIVAGVFALAKAIDKVVSMASLKLLNKLAGAVFGLLKVGLLLSILLLIIDAVDQRSGFLPADMKENSMLYEPVSGIAPTVIPAVRDSKVFAEAQDAGS